MDINININWRDVPENAPDDLLEILRNEGVDRASEQIQKGYVEGELHSTYYGNPEKNEEDQEYSGWWSIK